MKFKRLKSNLLIEIKYETQKILKVLFSLNGLWTVVKVKEELCFFHRIKIFIQFWRIVICQKNIFEFSEDTPQKWKICSKLIFGQMWNDIVWKNKIGAIMKSSKTVIDFLISFTAQWDIFPYFLSFCYEFFRIYIFYLIWVTN